MNPEPPAPLPRLVRSFIAEARHSSGPTLYMICEKPGTALYDIHESLPTGEVLIWPEPASGGPHQAETLVYLLTRDIPPRRLPSVPQEPPPADPAPPPAAP